MEKIGFIPVRGGSKSIPLKNIMEIGGKHLVFWAIDALLDSSVDKIVVSTDSDIIASIVKHEYGCRVEVFMRGEKTPDDATTESAMLEYIFQSTLSKDDMFVLVQATSPLVTGKDIDGGIKLMDEHNSVMSAVMTKRFIWNKNGAPLNYDYLDRPRRQDFCGSYIENGAFYINTVGNILRQKNRLSGNIGIYEMPYYTLTELDEKNDIEEIEKWLNLLRK